MDEESLSGVIADLDRILAQAAGAHAFAVEGLRLVLERFSGLPVTEDNPDPTLYVGLGDPNEADSRYYAAFKLSALPALLARDGPVVAQLGQQWAVFVFAEWEHSFRRRIAQARGCEVAEVEVDAFGDLRRIRHDILHNGAAASNEWTDKCEILKWFSAGDPIVIDAHHVADFMSKVPWQELKEIGHNEP